MAVVIDSVAPRSKARWHGIKPGDKLLEINKNKINDVLDYRFYITDEKLELLIETKSGKKRTVKIRNRQGSEIGLSFATYLMDKQRRCANNCIFCFIDQLPEGLRESLYFKDDDSRLSFFFGNYITLTNLKQEDIDRIIKMHISPINISVHTTNPELRVKMMGNKRAGQVLDYIRQLADAGIELHTQLVLCPGYNDGDELTYTISELYKMRECVKSVSVVPIGLTRHRGGLCPMEAVSHEKAIELITEIEKWQKKAMAEVGTGFVYASDEIYLKAGIEIPDSSAYHGFPQIENGVGMIASMREEFSDALENAPKTCPDKSVTLVCGVAAYDFLSEIAETVKKKYPNINITVEKIINDFFGHEITVSGLLCGCDIIAQLKDRKIGDTLIITKNMLRDGENVLLDDITTEDIEKALGVSIIAVSDDGYELLDAIICN